MSRSTIKKDASERKIKDSSSSSSSMQQQQQVT
jgi:hypothetical protein